MSNIRQSATAQSRKSAPLPRQLNGQFRGIDLTGQRFGRLVALRRAPDKASVNEALWWCRCNCGNSIITRATSLRKGDTRSCGCIKREQLQNNPIGLKHGHASKRKYSRTYRSWAGMLQRCENPNSLAFRWYGAKGVTVCARWHQFENFLADMGERPPGKTLDRLDNDRGYELENCRWATWVERTANKGSRRAGAVPVEHRADEWVWWKIDDDPHVLAVEIAEVRP